MDKEENKKQKLIKKILSKRLGIEIDDINDEDSFREDLHMNPVDLTDFSHELTETGLDNDSLDFSEIDSLEDLYQELF